MGLRSFIQMVHELLREVNSPIQRATAFDAQQAINDAYRDIHQFYNWSWLIDRYDIAIQPPYTTGTISVAVGSTAVTGVGTAWSTTWFNKKILLSGNNAEFEVASFTSPTTLVLRYPYQSTTNLVAQPYQIFQDDYPVPINSGRDLIILNPMWQWARLDKVDRWTFDDRTQFSRFSAVQGPTIFTDSGTDQNAASPTFQQPRFQFWPIPLSAQNLVLRFYRIPPPLLLDTDMTLLPIEFEEVLIKLGRFRLKRKFGVVGWMEDEKTAMMTLVQFREKQNAQTGYDQRPGSIAWPYADSWATDMSLGSWPGRILP